MVEVVHSLKLAYFPIRKVATTSVRKAVRALADGPDDLRSTWDVPLSAYTRHAARGCHRIVVVRDPVKRFLSAFSNRVIHHRDTRHGGWDRAMRRALGLSARPDIDEFCARYTAYFLTHDRLRRHFMAQRHFLGRNTGYFAKVYRIEHLDHLAADLSEIAGRSVSLPRLQTGGPKLSFADLSPATRRRILAITRADYAALAAFGVAYDPPEP